MKVYKKKRGEILLNEDEEGCYTEYEERGYTEFEDG